MTMENEQTTATITRRLVGLKTLSEIVSISEVHLRLMARQGRIPCYRPIRNYLFDPDEVVAALKKSRG